MTDWAAKVLEGVYRYTDIHTTDDMPVVYLDEVIAAIARMGAGDGLVERLLSVSIDMGEIPSTTTLPSEVIREAAAHIAALTAERDEAYKAVDENWITHRRVVAADAEAAALRAKVAENRIGEPHDPGDFVGDIFYGHPIKTTMGTHRWTGTEWVALPSEAEALAGLLAEARKEAAALRERVARLEGALGGVSASLHQLARDRDLSEAELDFMRGIDAAITDGGKDG